MRDALVAPTPYRPVRACRCTTGRLIGLLDTINKNDHAHPTTIAITLLIAIGAVLVQTGKMSLRLDRLAAVPFSSPYTFSTASELDGLRAWYQGQDTCAAVARYLDADLLTSASSRTVIHHIRRRLGEFARMRSRGSWPNSSATRKQTGPI